MGLPWLGLVLALYVLSVGPVARYYRGKSTPPNAVFNFYAPLIFLSKNVRPVENFFQWYVRVWTDEPATRRR